MSHFIVPLTVFKKFSRMLLLSACFLNYLLMGKFRKCFSLYGSINAPKDFSVIRR